MLTVTADEIKARAIYADRFRNYYVAADTGAALDVVSLLPSGEIIVRGLKADSPYGLLTRTGKSVSRDGLIRVRVDFARDTGDRAGTLAFDGPRVGGAANFRLFPEED